MLKFKCYTWNKYLPEQKLIDGTCSFHSLRNINYMIKILSDIKTYNNSSYITKIKKNTNFNKLISIKQLNTDLNFLIDNNNLRLNGKQLKKIIKKKGLSQNIFPVYFKDCTSQFYHDDLNLINKIIKKKSYIIGFNLFVKRLNIKHWCPVIIDKKDNIINVHIVDSYNMTWWGDSRINSLINYLYPGKKNITCTDDNFKGSLYYISKTIFDSSVYFIALYLFIYAIFIRFKLI